MKIENSAPTWEAAARIYMAVLQNPAASPEAISGAEQEILRVARIADAFMAALQKEGK